MTVFVLNFWWILQYIYRKIMKSENPQLAVIKKTDVISKSDITMSTLYSNPLISHPIDVIIFYPLRTRFPVVQPT